MRAGILSHLTVLHCLCAALWTVTFILHCVGGLREPWKMASFGFLALTWTGLAAVHVFHSLRQRRGRVSVTERGNEG